MIVRELITLLGFQVDDKKARSYEQTLNKVKRTVVLLLGSAGIAGLGKVLLETAGDMEQTTMAFETMLGSADAAKKVLGELTDFAAKTPFERTDLIQYAKQLLAFGFSADELIPTMTHLGDIASGVGKDRLPSIVLALGKIRTKGRATMEELNIMLESGVPILDALAKKYGVTTAKVIEMVSKGQVGFKDVNDALTQMSTGSGKFSGLMVKQSKSLLGMISNVKDFFSSFAADIGGELLPMAKDLVTEFLNLVNANKDIIKSTVVKVFKALFTVIGYVVVIFERLIARLGGWGNIMRFIGGVLDTFWTGLKAVIAVLWPFRNLILAIAIVWAVWNVIMALSPITWIILAIVALIFAIGLLIKNWDKVSKFMKGLWAKIKKWVKDAVDKVKGFFVNLWNGIVNAAKSVWGAITGAVQAVVDWIVAAWMKIKEFFAGLWTGIVEGAVALWDNLKKGFQAIVDWIIEAWTKVKEFFQGIWDGIVGAIDKFKEFLGIAKDSGVTVTASKVMDNATGVLPRYAQGTPYVPEDQLAYVHKGERIIPRGQNFSRSVTISAPATVVVPPGTPAAQRESVRREAERVVQETWSRIVRGAGAELAGIGG